MLGSWTGMLPGFASGNFFVVWYTCFALWAPDWDGIAPSGVAIAMIIDRSRRWCIVVVTLE